VIFEVDFGYWIAVGVGILNKGHVALLLPFVEITVKWRTF